MKVKVLSTLFILLTSIVFAQKNFEEGYYINTKGVRIEGYIMVMNFDRINSVSDLEFKKDLNQKTSEIPTSSIQEFGIGTELKFQKLTVDINDVDFNKKDSEQKELTLTATTLFLNVLVEGNATLYSFTTDNGTQYLYKIKDKNDQIAQLVRKKYTDNEMVKENNFFRNQLFNDVKCEGQTFNEFINLEYNKKQLASVFQKYNECKNSQAVTYKNKFKKESQINLIGFAGMSVFNPSATGLGFGGEIEWILPSRKLALALKLEYESFSNDAVNSYNTQNNLYHHEDEYHVKYKSVDIILVGRYYFNLTERNKVFVNLGFGITNQLGDISAYRTVVASSGTFVDGPFHGKLESEPFLTLGAGYMFNNKFGFDVNYNFDKRIFIDASTKYEIMSNKIGINFRYVFN